jgi:hypothetical protein
MNTTTENLPAIQPARQPIIFTCQCGHGWMACMADKPDKMELGPTETEAIGRLHIIYQKELGAVQRQERP